MPHVLFVMSIGLMLSACGSQDAALIIPKPEINDVRVLRHDLLEISLHDSALAGPNFQDNRLSAAEGGGGVEHASQHDIVVTDFDENRLGVAMTIQREDGEKVQLNSTSHAITEPLNSVGEERRGALLDYGFSENHKRRHWTLLRTTRTGASTAYAEINWDDHDPTNYLAGGYWMHLDRVDLDWSPAPWAIDDADVGAFIYGPEFTGSPTIPLQGVASYRGRATGLYTFFYGPAWANLGLFKVRETGIFHGAVQLTADFSKNEIEGCIGCLVEGEATSWRHLDLAGSILLPAGVKAELYALYHNYKAEFPEGFDLSSYDQETFGREIDIRGSQIQVYMGPTAINEDGSFHGDEIRQELVYFPEGGTTGGTWGGRLSDMNDADGNPRRAIGTMGWHWEHIQGGWGRFVGNFYGTTNPVKQ